MPRRHTRHTPAPMTMPRANSDEYLAKLEALHALSFRDMVHGHWHGEGMAGRPKPNLDHIVEQLRPLAVPIDSLTVDPANARSHDDRNIDAIAHSLSTFQQRLPIVVQKTGMVVRAGNGRIAAAKRLGWKYIAAIVTDDSEQMAMAFSLEDNRTSELAEWDPESLYDMVQSLVGTEFEIPEILFTGEEIEEYTNAFQVDEQDMPNLDAESSPYQQITFQMTHEQMAKCREAIGVSRGQGDFGDTGNTNANGNAVARICEFYLDSQQNAQ